MGKKKSPKIAAKIKNKKGNRETKDEMKCAICGLLFEGLELQQEHFNKAHLKPIGKKTKAKEKAKAEAEAEAEADREFKKAHLQPKGKKAKAKAKAKAGRE